MTGVEYVARVVECARDHGATVNETLRGAIITGPGGALLELVINTDRLATGTVHQPDLRIVRGVKWHDLDCLVALRRCTEAMPLLVDGPAPAFAPVAPRPSGFGSGAIDDTKGT